MHARGAMKIAWIRVGVGVLMILAPRGILRLARGEVTGSMMLLTRTIGIRDLVLGGGALLALASDDTEGARRWVAAGLASDSLDVIAGATSVPLVGRGSALFALGLAAPLAAADALVLAENEQDTVA